ncbi:MAG: hypothetical protein DWQ05_04935 [Calditrichaeota bacterium]|nr:MAG: hypothetical protein DWQ05_04935 [Calditrichota bacterium]
MRSNLKTGFIFLAGLFFLPTLALVAQKVNVKVDGQKIKNTIAHISTNDQMGRKPNTPEFMKLQDWLVEQYEEWGMEPAGENGTFFQAVPIKRNYSVNYGTPKLVINGREFFSRYRDFTVDSRSTPGLKLQQKIVFAGYGIAAPDKGLDEYNGIDVSGKLVFVLNGNPADFTPPSPRLAPRDTSYKADSAELWETESSDSSKIMTAYNKGAAGIIFYNPKEESDPFRRFRQQVEKSPFTEDFIVVSQVSKEIFHWLFWTDPQMSSRAFKTWIDAVRTDIQQKKVRSFVTKMKAEITGFDKTLLKGTAFNDSLGRNIIAKITGSDPELKNEYVVIGAHFDHVGVTNGQVYNGAEDNGTGSGVLIELARLLKQHKIQTKRTLILCNWDAEELGLIGSRYWVENPTDGVTMDRVVTYFNMDMVGLGPDIGATGALNFPTIWEVIKRDQDEDILSALKPNKGGPGGSDYAPFILLGIEALGLMTGGPEGHPDYHDTGDDAHKLDAEILRKTGQFVLQGAVNVGNETTVPLLIADREHIFSGMYWPLRIIDPEVKTTAGEGLSRSSSGNWNRLEAKSPVELHQLMIKKIKELKDPPKDSDPFSAWRQRYKVTRRDGILGVGVFNSDSNMIKLAKEVINFGRLDVSGDDGMWFNQGLTEAGTNALKMMEKNKIALHLMKPEKATVLAVLEKSEKAFLITGFNDFDDGMLEKLKNRKALIGVDFDPQKIEECVSKLEFYKSKLDTTSNLVLNVIAGEGLSEAKQDLYMQLIKKGWEKNAIYAIGGASLSRRGKSNFDVLPGGRPPFPRF